MNKHLLNKKGEYSMSRLETMKQYLAEAIERNDPSDKLYIEDLQLSISFWKEEPVNKVFSGFDLTKE